MIYPNPFTDKTTLQLLNPSNKLLALSLFDQTGRKIKDFSFSNDRNTIVIERKNLAKGIYMLMIRTQNYTSKSKLIIK
jgi:hypothetical protein